MAHGRMLTVPWSNLTRVKESLPFRCHIYSTVCPVATKGHFSMLGNFTSREGTNSPLIYVFTNSISNQHIIYPKRTARSWILIIKKMCDVRGQRCWWMVVVDVVGRTKASIFTQIAVRKPYSPKVARGFHIFQFIILWHLLFINLAMLKSSR